MRVFLDLPNGFYAVKDNELYTVDLPIAEFPNTKRVKVDKIEVINLKQSVPVQVTDNPELDLVELHHVTYDNEQLGREK